MKDGALASDRDGKGISRTTGKDAESRSSSGGYKTRMGKKGMTIPNNPEFISWPLGSECGSTVKGKSGCVVGGI